MKKIYQKPKAEVVKVRCKDTLLWGEHQNASNNTPFGEAKDNQFFGEDDEMQKWNDIFSNDRQDPWDGVDDPWK